MNLNQITSNEEILQALTPVPDFPSRESIKPWINENLESRGINLVIERSDASKVVFKCKNVHRKSITTPRQSSSSKLSAKELSKLNSKDSSKSSLSKSSKRARSGVDDSCPFRLRVSFSVKHKVWAVNIIKEEHSPSLCCNFGEHKGAFTPSSTTPGSTISSSAHKRSWTSVYTPASTVSPAFSSPATSSFTPASEVFEMDHEEFKPMKRSKHNFTLTSNSRYIESPLYKEIDPLDKLSLPEDLSDINHLYGTTHDTNYLNDFPLDNFDVPLDFIVDQELDITTTTTNNNNTTTNDNNNLMFGLTQTDTYNMHDSYDDSPICDIIKEHPITTPINKVFVQNHMQTHQLFNTDSVLKSNMSLDDTRSQNDGRYNHHGHHHNQQQRSTMVKKEDGFNGIPQIPEEDEGEDPMMYLLNTGSTLNSNSNYTIEELENLDKAMGFDDNDKFLMSMFQQ